MRAISILIVTAFILSAATTAADRIAVGKSADDISVNLLTAEYNRVSVRIDIGAFYKESVTIGGTTYYSLSLAEENILARSGEPALPRICRSLIIPNEGTPSVRILSSEYVDLPSHAVVPSKGQLLRTENPADVPYRFGDIYAADTWYPATVASLRDPFILRDYRGTVLEVYPFQYNPVTQTLRVYTSLTLEVVTEGLGGVNVLSSDPYRRSRIAEFDRLYERRFLNYGARLEKYAPLAEDGDMLIIAHDAFHDAVLPFAAWKQQKGIKTTLVDVSTIGNSVANIAAFIQNFYDTTDLAWVLLVGDAGQIAVPTSSGGASDPTYAKVAGSDNYPDIVIGRFSAETVAQVQTQVARTVAYESDPRGTDWFHRGTGIGSAEGAGIGHNGEADFTHMSYLRNDLLGFTYSSVDAIYDPGATAADVSAALNAGRGIVNYCGHGSSGSWGTTGFSQTSIAALTDTSMLPFIISVACVNGAFVGQTCFAEAWLRSTLGGAPIGAVATYMSSINQSWSPPMDAQDECVDLLTTGAMTTFGGICFNGACKMIDLNGADGADMYNTWHIFGDPSLQVWTDTPAPLTVNHDPDILKGRGVFAVEVVGIADALCALTADGVIYGTAHTGADGVANIPLGIDLPVGQQNMTLTITAFNKMPYTALLNVIAPLGPYLVIDGLTIDDASSGNGDGRVDCGETVGLTVELQNAGQDDAVTVTGTLSSVDPYISITNNTADFGTIPGNGGTVSLADAFTVVLQSDVPDNRIISLTLTLTDASDSSWVLGLSLTAHAPHIELQVVTVDDASWNQNGVLDPGETAPVWLTIVNSGSGQADNLTVVLTGVDDYVTVVDDAGVFDVVTPNGGIADNQGNPFMVGVGITCPRGRQVDYDVAVTGDRGFSTTLHFSLIIGQRDAFFVDDFSTNRGWSGLGGPGEWAMGAAVGGTGADSYGRPDPSLDHTSTSDNRLLGTDLTGGAGGDYNALAMTYWVTSPIIDCSRYTGVILDFYRWLGVEKVTYDRAIVQMYDGATWTTVFQNPDINTDDTIWTLQEFDVSAVADSNAAFQFRFGIGPSDGAWFYCGWNIDDIALRGFGEVTYGRLVLSTESLTDSLVPGDTAVHILYIYNQDPDWPLQIRFTSAEPWLDCSDAQQVVPPADSLAFPITIRTAGMFPGDYAGIISYVCNDYLHPCDTVEAQIHLYAPTMTIACDSLPAEVAVGMTGSVPVIISNSGPGLLEYAVTCSEVVARGTTPAALPPLGTRSADDDKSAASEPFFGDAGSRSGGPDNFGYRWICSDDSRGPSYTWVDIVGFGTVVSLDEDAFVGPIPLGFRFPFYESHYSTVYIGSNGLLTFGAGSGERLNTALPNPTAPNAQIALWWDDLSPNKGGAVCYYADSEAQRFIISFIGVKNYAAPGGTGSLTFQAILYADGRIILQYGLMDPGSDADGLAGATIGLENDNGDDGLAAVYNGPFMHSNMAVSFDPTQWLAANPGFGTVPPYSADTIDVVCDATDLAAGLYSGRLTISSNDPQHLTHAIPVTLAVQEYTCGDANTDLDVNLADAVYIICYVFKGGTAPSPLVAADVNGDATINIADAVSIVNYIFKGGDAPVCQ